ncbi:MAG TPA: FAD:protein FMN transferase [Tepidisphaeraceae bacterium]|nr:FAD:protein FMN transferase [Tepidisphaeraceae bacterium]
MSTPVRICFVHEQLALAMELQRAVVEWVACFEARYSRFIPQSIVGQINANAGGDWLEVDAETDELLGLCEEMHAFTRGVFDAASLPLMRLWDWKSKPSVLPSSNTCAAVREKCGWDKINRRPRSIRLPDRNMGIDIGGIGKEYAVDRVVHLARERGTKDLLVDIGQDVRVFGHPPLKDAWYIGLEEPDSPGDCWTCLRLTNHAVATSGDYFRSFTIGGRRYGHIVDPRTGEPVSNGCQAVTVVASTCTIAGVLSTAAFILGPDDGLKLIQRHGNAQACITAESARHQTRRFSSYVAV